MRRTTLLPLMLAAVLAAAFPAARAQTRVGDEFQVNTYTTGHQGRPEVASGPSGDFLVVWESSGAPGSTDDWPVVARRYASDGSAQGIEFQVNTYTTESSRSPHVAAGPSGEFVVVWQSYVGSTYEYQILAQRLSSTGTFLGAELEVSDRATKLRAGGRPAIGPKGDFVVAWTSFEGPGGAEYEIKARRFASSGAALGGEIQVNAYTTGDQRGARVATAPNGDFVVVWETWPGPGEHSYDVVGRRFASDGTALATEFPVATYTTGQQSPGAVAVAPNGEFVVTWSSDGSFGSDDFFSSVQARRFASNGDPLGDQFQVNTYTTDDQWGSAVAISPEGEFVVVWESDGSSGSDNSYNSVQGRWFAADGTPKGEDFQVNSYTTESQDDAWVAMTEGGEFVVVWESRGSSGSDNSEYSVQAQRYATAIRLENGVEVSGSVNGAEAESGWSFYYFDLEADQTSLVVDLFELSEDADLYVRWGSKPDLSNYLCRPWLSGVVPEQCIIEPAAAGRWWVGIVNWALGPITYKVRATWSSDHIFSDDFESGNTDAWSYVEGK